ncbi:MAG TPA: hypothetical protein PLY93_02045, partial [Turneriella sp.]|nr:hypothetical protein [Turneriella sp.]
MQKDTKTQGKSGSKEYAHLLKLYLDEKSRAKAIALAQDDLKSLDMIVQFETMLALNKRNAAAQRATKFALATHEVMEIAEQFFSVDDPHLMEKMLSKNKVWQKLKTSDADFSLFQDILSFLFTWFEKPLIPTPAYLKQIIMNRLQTAAPAPTTGAIVIRCDRFVLAPMDLAA